MDKVTALSTKLVAILFGLSAIACFVLTSSLSISWGSYGFHMAIIAGGLWLCYVLSIVVVRFTRESYGGWLIWIIWTLPTCLLLLIYVLFYISIKNWGLPMHHTMAVRQLPELPLILSNLPVNSVLVYCAIILPLIGIGLGYGIIARRLHRALRQQTNLSLNNRAGRRFWLVNAMSLLLLVVVAITPGVLYRLRLTFPAIDDPVLSFLFSDDVHEGHAFRGLGLEHVTARHNYPEGLIHDRPNVILIMCDALRADHLGAYGYNRKASPFLDSLAADTFSLLHPRYFATSGVSFVGITTSLSSRDKMTTNSFMLHQVLKKQGYTTDYTCSGDFKNFYNLDSYLGEGIDHFHDGDAYRDNPYAGNISTADDRHLVIENLRRKPQWNGQPYYLYLHLMSAHQVAPVEERFRRYKPDKIPLLNPDAAALVNDYDNRIIQLDEYLRSVFRILSSRGYLDDAIVAITADHGQSLLEGDHYWHGKSTDMTETHIPLLIHTTGRRRLPTLPSAAYNDQTDLAPTIVSLLELPKPNSWDGVSIFSDSTQQIIYQKQAKDYSAIFMHDSSLYQVTIHPNDESIEQLDITEPVNPMATDELTSEQLSNWADRIRIFYDDPVTPLDK